MKLNGRIVGVPQVRSRLDRLGRGLTREEAETIGKLAIEAMRQLISRGISPIRGAGRFPRYKHPDKYPGKRKPHSPVNLFLTGRFLAALTFDVLQRPRGFAAVLGFFDDDAALIEEGHRIGWNGQPRRAIIPAAGEKFAATVENAYLKVILDSVKTR